MYRFHDWWGLQEPPDFVTFAKKFQSGGYFHRHESIPPQVSGEFEAGPGLEVGGWGCVEGVGVEDGIMVCERRVGVCGSERDSERALTASSNITTSTPLPPTHTRATASSTLGWATP